MLDALTFASAKIARRISGIYAGITTRAPSFFGGLYRLGEVVSSEKRKSPVYYVNTLYSEALGDYIRENDFSAVINLHIFSAQAVTHLMLKNRLKLPVFAVATDYTCIPFWEETEAENFFIPHGDLIEEFAGNGIPREKLVSYGLPVSAAFNSRVPKEEARERLALPKDGNLLLLMTGSMGYGDMSSLTTELLKELDCRIAVLTGNNKKLLANLGRRFGEEERVFAVPFTPDVPLYMDACDVLLTKPGGLTSTEAAVKNIPVVYTKAIPGCETRNAEFFSSRGLVLSGDTPKEAASAAARLLEDEELREDMLKKQRDTIPQDAAGKIAGHILSRLTEERT